MLNDGYNIAIESDNDTFSEMTIASQDTIPMSNNENESIEAIPKNMYFADVEMLQQMENGFTPKNTQRKQKWATNKFNEWRSKRNSYPNVTESEIIPTKSINEFSVEELNFTLQRFVVEVRDKNGQAYRPKTMLEIVLSIQQSINSNVDNGNYKFLSDPRFKKIRGTMDSIMVKQA